MNHNKRLIKMHNKNVTRFLLMFSIFIFFLVSCNQSDIGIFYGIENEEEIVDRSLSNYITIGSMGKLGSNLYIAAGKVYKKQSGTDKNWEKCRTPSGYDLCTSLTVFENTDIFSVWFNQDNANTGFFKSNDGGSTWVSVSGSFTGDFSFVKSAHAAAADGVMVVSTVTGNNSGNYYTTVDGSSFSIISGVNALGGHFDIDYDGSNYWFLTKENIYKETDNDLTTLPAASQGKVDDEYFNYIYTHDATHVYVTRSWGKISFYDNSSWDNNVEDLNINVNDMITFKIGPIDNFFVGTDRMGYYEPESPGIDKSNIESLNDPERDTISCDYQTYNSSDLKSSAVLAFFKDDLTGDGDTADDELYALTYGKGLWKNINKNGKRKWQRE